MLLNPVILEERILLRIRKAKFTIFYYLAISGWGERRMKWRHLEECPDRYALCGTAFPQPQPWGGWGLGVSWEQSARICWKEEQMPMATCWPTALLPSFPAKREIQGLWKSPSKTKTMSQQPQKEECWIPCHNVVGDRIERDVLMFISQNYLGGKNSTVVFCKDMHKFQKFHELWTARWPHIPIWNTLEHILKTSHTTKNVLFSFEDNLFTSFRHAWQ